MALSAAQIKEVEKASKEIESCRVTITWLAKKEALHATTPIVEVIVDQYLNTLKINQDKVEDAFQRIFINDPIDPILQNQAFETLMDIIMDLTGKLLTIKSSFPLSAGGSGGPTPPPKMDIKLPQLELPLFDRKIEDWMAFRDMFTAAIHSKASLSNTQKLTYLKTQLSGEAARLIQALPITDANYDIAWKQLGDRYQNDRQLLFALVNRLFGQAVITTPSSTAVRSLIV